ncbi:MAG: phage portal protein, partial [Angelakisella sp.]
NDLAIQDSITLDLKTVACAFGIPPFLVGVGTFNKDEYNNFVSTTIMSIATNVQQELTKKLLFSPTMYFKFNQKSLMQYSPNEKVQFVKEMVGGGMLNRNEGRTEFDYSPVDVEGMNDYTVLENYLQVADLNKQKKLIQEGGAKDE